MYRCLLRVLCPARRPVTTLNCILLKDSSQVSVEGLGQGLISSGARLWVLVKTRPLSCAGSEPALNIFLCVLPRDPQSRFRPNKLLNGSIPCELAGQFHFHVSQNVWVAGDINSPWKRMSATFTVLILLAVTCGSRIHRKPRLPLPLQECLHECYLFTRP